MNTHHHPDHTYGNGFLPAETLVIGHEKCRDEVLHAGLEATKVITAPDYGDLTLRPPELTFPDRMTLHLRRSRSSCTTSGSRRTPPTTCWSGCPSRRCCSAATWRSTAASRSCWRARSRASGCAIAQMRALAPEVLVPGHGPVCRGDEVDRLLTAMDGYLDVRRARRRRVARRRPDRRSRRRRSTRDNPYSGWAETERFVGNLHRAYAELDSAGSGHDGWTRLTVPSVWPDMVAFHGGPIACHA